jgi:hypothetical protein
VKVSRRSHCDPEEYQAPSGDILKRDDLFDIVLIQIKGASAPGAVGERLPSTFGGQEGLSRQICRPISVEERPPSQFFTLSRNLEWESATSREMFEQTPIATLLG